MLNRHFPHGRRILAAGALTITAVLVAACGSGGSARSSASSSGGSAAGSSSSPSETTITVGYVVGNAPGLLTALKDGIFAKEHLNVQLVGLSGGPAIVSAVAGGSLDIGWADMYAWSSAIEQGFNVTLLNPANGPGKGDQRVSVLMASPHSGITSAKDLTGKKIGVPAQALTTVEVKQWLANQGLNPNGPHYTTVNDRSTEGGLVAGGQIDVAATTGAYVTEWEAEYGLKVIGDYDGGVPSGAATSGYGSLKSWAQSHSGAVTRFVEAVRAGVKTYQSDTPAEQNAIVAAYGGADVSKLESKYPGALQAAATSSDTELPGPFNVSAENKWLQVGVKFGALKKPLDISTYFWPTATETLPLPAVGASSQDGLAAVEGKRRK